MVALDGVSVGLRRGTFTAIMGPSGSGKSTLLQCAAGLDRPTSGSVVLDGVELTSLGERERTRLRRRRIGFVFQAFNLLPALTVRDNVALPLRLAGRRPERGAVEEVLERVGLGGRLRSRPGELSGGQQQRVAIARALIARPAVLFGDEPTGALDTGTAREVLGLLREAVEETGQTVVMAIDSVGVLLAPGTEVGQVARAVEAALGDAAGSGAAVLTGDDRGRAEDPTLVEGTDDLIPLAAAFGSLAALAMVFVVAGTVGLSIRQRQRQTALLRAVGATPGQLRRMILAETMILAVAATVPACLLAPWFGRRLLDVFVHGGVVSDLVAFRSGAVPLIAGAGPSA